MKSRWLVFSLLVMMAVVIGCRRAQKRACATCGTPAPLPTTTYVPPTQAPVFDNQFVTPPTQTFDGGAVPLETAPIQGGFSGGVIPGQP